MRRWLTAAIFAGTLAAGSWCAAPVLAQTSIYILGRGGIFTSIVQFPDGTKAAPSVAYSSESSSGWYRAGTGDVRLSVLNTDRITAGASTTTLNGPDGGAYFQVSNSAVQANSSTFSLASAGTARILFPTPSADGNLKYTNNAGTHSLTTDVSGTPSCSSNCGTSPSVAGSNSGGTVTMGSSGVPASAWVLTFTNTWAAAPSCSVTSALATMVVGKMAIAVVTTTTTMTVTTNGTAPSTSDKYFYHCELGG